MSLLSWLFGRKSAKNDLPAQAWEAPHASTASPSEPEFIDIAEPKFFGQCIRSPNGRFMLAWADASGTEGGYRHSGHGRYLLMEGPRVIADGKMPRPNDGKVANNGAFVLNDWGFGDGLHGIFCAFRADGSRCLSKKFEANLFNNGLSADGRFAACQTCNSDHENDSAVLTIFDLTQGMEIARWRAVSGWPDFYEFVADGSTIRLGYRGLGAFLYTLNGEFPDRAAWERATLDNGDYSRVLMMSEALIKQAGSKPSPEVAGKILRAVDRVLGDIPDNNWKAVAMKVRGTALAAQGAVAAALDCYETALTLNPKIGLKRRVSQLRKSLRSAGT